MAADDATVTDQQQPAYMNVPGNVVVWLFLLVEFTTFGLLFLVYSVLFRLNQGMFQQAQESLVMSWGVINTLLLITSGLMMVLAVHQHKQNNPIGIRRYLLAAAFFGAAYILVKFSEWYVLYSNGITMSSNTFYSFYYFLTAFHWMHVLLGLVFILSLWRGYRPGTPEPPDPDSLESVASYWHMLDMLWLILFLLVYVS